MKVTIGLKNRKSDSVRIECTTVEFMTIHNALTLLAQDEGINAPDRERAKFMVFTEPVFETESEV